MTEAVVEKVDLEAPAEDLFEFWSDAENFCAFVRSAEETRRVDLGRSRWLLRGPEGRSTEYEPEFFLSCLVGARNRLVHGTAGQAEPDAVVDRGELEFKRRSDGTTLLMLTYLADVAGRSGEGGDDEEPADNRGALSRSHKVYLDLHAILTNLYREAYEARSPAPPPWEPVARASRGIGPEEQDAPGAPASDGVISLLEEWASEDPAYDEETLPALKENLDRNRPDYRKPFGRG